MNRRDFLMTPAQATAAFLVAKYDLPGPLAGKPRRRHIQDIVKIEITVVAPAIVRTSFAPMRITV